MNQLYRITVIQNMQTNMIFECSNQETIFEAMHRQGISYRSDCGGGGTCGKCKVQVVSGILEVTAQDKVLFTEQELRDGMRLACKAVPQEDITIISGSASDYGMKGITQGIDDIQSGNTSQRNIVLEKEASADNYILGIDLGTTTLAFRLVDNPQGSTLATHIMVNPQRAYGADVVSRIKASNDGKLDPLKRLIRTALEEGINTVLHDARLATEQLGLIAIAGNTTMVHLLMGYSCQGLGIYPFTPVTLDAIAANSAEIVPGLKARTVPVTILPGISAFVGGDIVAGLAVCGYSVTEEISLLIDFGTNGEIALGNKDRLLVTSTAAGPAFEGGNLSCGVGSIPGAINHVRINEDEIIYDTIDQQPSIGICGTGAIELVAELYRTGIIDETGLLSEEYFATGFPLLKQGERHKQEDQGKQIGLNGECTNAIILTQRDIRELQMAKAAVRAGIEVLLERYGVDYAQVDKVFLAGGFGFYLDIDKAICIGLLPEEFKDKIVTVGNSSLAGAVLSGMAPDFTDRMKAVIANSQEIHLSNDEAFQALYLKHMYFGSSDRV